MVNIFGDRGEDGAIGPVGEIGPRGAKGSKGDPGSSGIDDMCRWLPKSVLEQFQKDEICCFTLDDPGNDLLKRGLVVAIRLGSLILKLN